MLVYGFNASECFLVNFLFCYLIFRTGEEDKMILRLKDIERLREIAQVFKSVGVIIGVFLGIDLRLERFIDNGDDIIKAMAQSDFFSDIEFRYGAEGELLRILHQNKISPLSVVIVLIMHLFQITFINTLRSAVFVRGDEVTIIVM